MILDYSEFVEKACKEEDGSYESYPSDVDVLRAAPHYIDPEDCPSDPFDVTEEEQRLAIDRWADFTLSRESAFGEWHHLSTCPHCRTAVDYSQEPSHLPGDLLRSVQVRLCRGCGWWDLEEDGTVLQVEGESHYEAPSVHRRAILRQFDVAGGNVPIDSLRDYLAKHPHALSAISPRALEKLVADAFGDIMNCEAVHVGGPNDGGIDVVLVQGDRRYVVQTKRRASNAAESVSSIREFVGAMVLAGEMRGIFVTTAPRFSESASAAARVAAQRGAVEYIELVTPKRLIEVCKLAAADDGERWERVRSQKDDLYRHMNPGFSTFMELFMGHPDWKMTSSDVRRRFKRTPSVKYRYFTFGKPDEDERR